MLHGVDRRGPPGGVRHPGAAGRRSDRHHARRVAARGGVELDRGVHGLRRQPVRVLHTGDHHAPGGALRPPSPGSDAEVQTALLAHLCRCTGWRTILDAAARVAAANPARPPPRPAGGRPARPGGRRDGPAGRAARRRRRRRVRRGHGADRRAVAVPAPGGGWAVGDSLGAARLAAGRVQGRNSTAALSWPLEIPEGDWDLVLRTTFVEPAYLEPDASWCAPGRRARQPARQRRRLRRQGGLRRAGGGAPPGGRAPTTGARRCCHVRTSSVSVRSARRWRWACAPTAREGRGWPVLRGRRTSRVG